MDKKIEQLKKQIIATTDPAKKAELKEQLKNLREANKKQGAQQFKDGLKEKNAKSALSIGDKGRAKRIRSSKKLQGIGEEGGETKMDKNGKLSASYKKNKGVSVKKKKK